MACEMIVRLGVIVFLCQVRFFFLSSSNVNVNIPKMDAQFRTMKSSVCYTCFLCFIFIFCQVLSCGYAEESTCTPGFESELFVFKVHRDHLHRGKRLGRGNVRLFSQISLKC